MTERVAKFVADEIWRAAATSGANKAPICLCRRPQTGIAGRGDEPHNPIYRETIEPAQELDGFRDDSPLEIPKVQDMPAVFAIATSCRIRRPRRIRAASLRMLADGYPYRTIAATLDNENRVEAAVNASAAGRKNQAKRRVKIAWRDGWH
jgi:hypothetical protein